MAKTAQKRGKPNNRPRMTPVAALPGRIAPWPVEPCDPAKMPTDGLFCAWELVDWRRVNELLDAQQAVCIEMPRDLSDDAERAWRECAEEQLGCQNMRVMFRYRTDGYLMWIIPVSALENVTPDCHELVLY